MHSYVHFHEFPFQSFGNHCDALQSTYITLVEDLSKGLYNPALPIIAHAERKVRRAIVHGVILLLCSKGLSESPGGIGNFNGGKGPLGKEAL